jgi:hypothetical protein
VGKVVATYVRATEVWRDGDSRVQPGFGQETVAHT